MAIKKELFEECYPIAMSDQPADGTLNASHGADVMYGVIAIRMVDGWDNKEDLFARVQQVNPTNTIKKAPSTGLFSLKQLSTLLFQSFL